MIHGSFCVIHHGSAVAELLADGRRVVHERVDAAAPEPAAVVHERLRHVPVVERQHRLDASLEQRIHEALVVVERRRVDRAAAVGQTRRPRRREPVGLQPELADDVDVVGASGGRSRSRPTPSPPPSIAPGRRQNSSQTDGPRPSASRAPSIW